LTVELAPLRADVLRRTRRVASKILDLDEQRETTVEAIDKYFEDLIAKARERAEALKGEYLAIQEEERVRLQSLEEKLNDDAERIQEYERSVEDEVNQFGKNLFFKPLLDQNEDHNINRQNLSRYVQTLEDVKADVESKFRFYKLPKYEHSVFVLLPEDIEKVSNIGRILNN
jgi:hypothetical protein